jgi:hypothetical protein
MFGLACDVSPGPLGAAVILVGKSKKVHTHSSMKMNIIAAWFFFRNPLVSVALRL